MSAYHSTACLICLALMAAAAPRQPKGNAGKPRDPAPDGAAKPAEPALKPESKQNWNGSPLQTLDQALAEALRHNPGVIIAEARVRESTAALMQARLAVVRDVTAAYNKWEDAKAKSAHVEKLQGKGYAHPVAVQSSNKVAAERELELRYLVGRGADSPPDDVDEWQREFPGTSPAQPSLSSSPASRPEMPARFRQEMETKIQLHFTDEPFANIVDYLQKVSKISFVFRKKRSEMPVTLILGGDDLTLGAALQALADQTDCCFIFRDYGVLVVERDEASRYDGAAIPGDVP